MDLKNYILILGILLLIIGLIILKKNYINTDDKYISKYGIDKKRFYELQKIKSKKWELALTGKDKKVSKFYSYSIQTLLGVTISSGILMLILTNKKVLAEKIFWLSICLITLICIPYMSWKLIQQSKNTNHLEPNSEQLFVLTLKDVKQRVRGIALTYVGIVLIIYSTMLVKLF